MAKILIKNGRVWDGERFFFADVLTNGGTVDKIGQGIADPADFVYDATGKTVSAGLVDAHMHFLVHPTDRFGTPADSSCFPFGVTAAADAGRSVGDPTVLDSFAVKNVVFANAHLGNNRANFDRCRNALALYGDRIAGIKVYFDTTQASIVDAEPLREVCEFARSKNLRVMVHSSHAPVKMAELLGVLRSGDILTHSFHGGENNAFEDHFESMKEAQKRGIVIDTGFAGHIHTDFGVLYQAIRAGIVPDVISTDLTRFSAFTRGGRYGMTMCMSIARDAEMREEDIFRAITANPAKALGKDNEWGYLRVGRAADIAVLDYTNESFDLTDGAGNHIRGNMGYRCVLTVSDGQVVFKD